MMGPLTLIGVLTALTGISFYVGKRRATILASGDLGRLRSRPHQHGIYNALWCAGPALAICIIWTVLQPLVVDALVVHNLPTAMQELPEDQMSLVLADIRNLAKSGLVARTPNPATIAAAEHLIRIKAIGNAAMAGIVIGVAILGLVWGRSRISPSLRSREAIERVLSAALFASSTIAVLTTIGIILSLLFETLRFFGSVPVLDFLFGLEWSPQTAIREDQVGASGACLLYTSPSPRD